VTPHLGWHAVLPAVCPRDPSRMAFAADVGGRCEIVTWDATTGRGRQVTDRAGGTLHVAVDDDAHVWWFDDDRRGVGVWRHQAFTGGADRPVLDGLRPGVPAGLGTADDGTVAIGFADGDGVGVALGRRGGPVREVLRVAGSTRLAGISPSGRLLAVTAGATSGRAVTVVTRAGEECPVGPGVAWSLGFADRPDAEELLLVEAVDDGYVLATWTPRDGLRRHRWCAFDTEITARWYPGSRRVLVRQDRHGRSTLARVDLDGRTVHRVHTPPGSVLDARPGPDDDVQFVWTDTATAPVLRSTAGTPLPQLRTAPPVPGQHRSLWTPGPDGPVHTLLSRPERRDAPLILLVHGGPADHDRDAYDPLLHALVASGFAVARVNYRGSTGYGPRWRSAFPDGVGLTQVADLVAVRADLVRRGLADPGAVGLCGTSWGGYLVLLALGRHPTLWQAGVAGTPIADYAEAYRAGTPALRALDERLFGGTPDDVPDRYERSSPITCAADVVAPLLLMAATEDTKCPPEQVHRYLAALRSHGVAHDVWWLPTGHDGHRTDDHATVLRRTVEHLDRTLRPPSTRFRPDRGSTSTREEAHTCTGTSSRATR
jgi:dipeptidyl aminopeptidase/acylaminoacyl peptidase